MVNRETKDTRSRIVESAMELVHSRGFQQTTLAQFAEAADIPLGNFYYYFKTKDSLGESLIDKRAAAYRDLVAEWEREPSPQTRLLNFIAHSRALSCQLTEHGCPVGGLALELSKKGGPLGERVAGIFEFLLGWTAQQFKAMGLEDESSALAIQMISALQGTTLLANVLNRPAYLLDETERLSRWIRELPRSQTQTSRK